MNAVVDQIALASYSFHKLLEEGMIDVYGYLESLAYRYQLRLADIWNGFVRELDESEYPKIRRALDARGLVLANLCCDWAHPWSDDPEQLRQNNEMAERMLRCAEVLGARTVRIDLGVQEDEITEAQFDYVAGRFTQYARFAADAGFVVGPENHWGASRRLSVQRRLYSGEPPSYGMLLHLNNWILEEGRSYDETDRLAAPLAVHSHVAYELAQRADEVLPALREAGYRGPFSVEHHRGVEEYEGVAAQLGMVRYALAKDEARRRDEATEGAGRPEEERA